MNLTEFFDQLYETHNSTQALDLCCKYIRSIDESELIALEVLSRIRSTENKLIFTQVNGKAIRKASLKLLKWSSKVILKAYKLEGNPGAAFGRLLDCSEQNLPELTPSLLLENVKKLDLITANQQVGFIIELARDYSQKSVEWFLRLFGPGEGVAFDYSLFIKSLAKVWSTNELQVINLFKSKKPIGINISSATKTIQPVFGEFYPQPSFTNALSSELPTETYISLYEPPGVLVQYHYSHERQLMFLADGTNISGIFPEFEIELKIAGNAILFAYIVPQNLENQTVQEWFDKRLQLPQMDMFARHEAPCALCLYDAAMLNGVELTKADYIHRLTKLRQHQYAEPIYKLKYDYWQPEHEEQLKTKGAMILIHKSALLHPLSKSDDYLRVSPYRFRAIAVEACTEFGRESDPLTIVTLALQDTAGRFVRVGSASIKHLASNVINELNDLLESQTLKHRANSRILEPTVVFEVDCDGFAQSNRHISKTVLHQPKIVRWLRGISVSSVDNIDRLSTSINKRR